MKERKKKNLTHGMSYCQNLLLSGIIHAPICNRYAAKIAEYVLKLKMANDGPRI